MYSCPHCTAELKRVVPLNERIASVIGYATLFVASLMSLWKIVMANEEFAKTGLIALYSISIIGIGATIIFAITHQHYLLKPSFQNDIVEKEMANN